MVEVDWEIYEVIERAGGKYVADPSTSSDMTKVTKEDLLEILSKDLEEQRRKEIERAHIAWKLANPDEEGCYGINF